MTPNGVCAHVSLYVWCAFTLASDVCFTPSVAYTYIQASFESLLIGVSIPILSLQVENAVKVAVDSVDAVMAISVPHDLLQEVHFLELVLLSPLVQLAASSYATRLESHRMSSRGIVLFMSGCPCALW